MIPQSPRTGGASGHAGAIPGELLLRRSDAGGTAALRSLIQLSCEPAQAILSLSVSRDRLRLTLLGDRGPSPRDCCLRYLATVAIRIELSLQ